MNHPDCGPLFNSSRMYVPPEDLTSHRLHSSTLSPSFFMASSATPWAVESSRTCSLQQVFSTVWTRVGTLSCGWQGGSVLIPILISGSVFFENYSTYVRTCTCTCMCTSRGRGGYVNDGERVEQEMEGGREGEGWLK